MAKIKVISGFPGSGKTTHINKNKSSNDLIFDYDEIASVIALQDKHVDNTSVHPYLIDILENMIKRAKNDKNVEVFWIIRTVPDNLFRNMLRGADAEYYFINKTISECLEQIGNDPERINSNKTWYALLMDIEREYMKGVCNDCIFIND
ncbi:MAG: hypothetical protein ACOYEB_00565 [Enterococcus lemanii]|jgi:predicted ABC-type ATPase